MMFCPNCGRRVDKEMICPYCGKEIIIEKENVYNTQSVNQTYRDVDRTSQNNVAYMIIVVIVSLMFPIIGFIMYFVFRNNNEKVARMALIIAIIRMAFYVILILFSVLLVL